MTSLSGEFQTDLGIDDAMVACSEAIDGLGWRIDTVDAQRVIAFTDSGSHPPRIEVNLNESGDGTEFRIIGSDNEQNQLEQDELIAVLDQARDAINRSMEDAERPRDSSKSPSTAAVAEQQSDSAGDADAAAGWYPDIYDESRERYWDGEQWTDEFRPAGGGDEEPQEESKPGRKSRKEARSERRRQSRERAEQRRRERLEKRQGQARQSGASASGAAVGGAAAGGAAAGLATGEGATGGGDSGGSGSGGDRGSDANRAASAPQGSPESATPEQFRSLHLIATLYRYLGYIVIVGGAIAVIAAAASAGGGGAIGVLIGGAIGVAFYALLVFGIAAAIRLALAVEKNTRDTAELLRRERERER